MATSYSQLLTDVPAALNNDSTELADALGSILERAQDRLFRDLKVSAYYAVTTGAAFTPNSPLIAVPADQTKIRYVRWRKASGVWVTLEHKELPFIFEYWDNPTTTGEPRYYGWYSNEQLYVAPTPASALTYEIGYSRRLPLLSLSNETNWLTDEAGDVLFYACMLEAGAFTIDGQQLQTYSALYKDAVAAINGEAERTLRDDLRMAMVDTANN